jgi:hypothetical protein
MMRWFRALSWALLLAGCTHAAADSLTGSESQVYDLTFNSVVILLEGSSVSVKYVGSSGDPAYLVVDTANISNVAGSAIDLTQLVGGQPRGVLQNISDANTNQLGISLGTVVLDQVPKVGSTLSGAFNATLTDGFTLNGTFSGTVNAP